MKGKAREATMEATDRKTNNWGNEARCACVRAWPAFFFSLFALRRGVRREKTNNTMGHKGRSHSHDTSRVDSRARAANANMASAMPYSS